MLVILTVKQKYHTWYQNDLKLQSEKSNIICICVPSVNYAVASCLSHQGLPTTPYGGGESTSTAIAPTSTHRDTSMAMATQPCLSILS